jgi:type III restriction enzyme
MATLYDVYNQQDREAELLEFKNAWHVGTFWRKGLRYTPRPHQDEAIARLEHYETYLQRFRKERYLLFHMATGSGKTLVMASALLYYYHLGYRRFMFISEKNVLLDKTKTVLCDASDEKYLFSETLRYNNNRLTLHATENLQTSTDTDIYLCFKSIQTLQNELDAGKARENTTHWEDLQGVKTVFFVDEAHHFTDCENNDEKRWKGILEGGHTLHPIGLMDGHPENRILGFSATLKEGNSHFDEAYGKRILFNYAFKAYRQAGYTKEPELVALPDITPLERILLACLNSLYRQYIAGETYGLTAFTPKVLVKFPTTKVADDTHKDFEQFLTQVTHQQIETLLGKLPASFAITENLADLQKQFDLVGLLKQEFLPFSVNHAPCKVALIHGSSKKKDETIQAINQMDSKDKPLRLVFAVNMLDEGWDVLSLFDIVRYEESGNATKGIITSDVQLIGRGARYYPFKPKVSIFNDCDADKRKDIQGVAMAGNFLRSLETLTYFTNADTAYLTKLKKEALETLGGLNEPTKQVECVSTLKESFTQSRVYTDGLLISNKFKPFEPLSLAELENRLATLVSAKAWRFTLNVAKEEDIYAITKREEQPILEETSHPHHWGHYCETHPVWKDRIQLVFENALDEAPYFRGRCLFQKLTCQDRIAVVETCLRIILPNMEWLNFNLSLEEPLNLSKVYSHLSTYFEQKVLPLIKKQIERNMGCSELRSEKIRDVLEAKLKSTSGKIIEFLTPNASDSSNTTPLILTQETDNFYIFDRFYGTTLEQDVIKRIRSVVSDAMTQYDEFYLIRNHHFLKLYGEDGRGFKPDFLLYTFKHATEKPVFHLVFLEPKNATLAMAEEWKENLLLEVLQGKEYQQHQLLALRFITDDTLQNLTTELKQLLAF